MWADIHDALRDQVRTQAGRNSEPTAAVLDRGRRSDRVRLEIVKRGDDVKGFQVLPRRWVVETTFAWLGRCRRLARDFERRTIHGEAMIHIAMIGLMLRRLTSQQTRYRNNPGRQQ